MSLPESIFAKLSNPSSQTAALAGSGEACRVYYLLAPDGVQSPYCVYQPIASTGAPTHGEPVGTAFGLVQFSCYATTAASARGLRAALIADLDGERLDDGGGDSPTLQDQRDDYEEAVELYRADADFLI